jgi:predicted ATPase
MYRFQQVFTNFLTALTSSTRPIVIFIDDLQWSDSSTLTMLTTLLVPPSLIRHLLIVGAYRDNEVNDAHPLVHTLQEIKENGGLVQDLTLQPLSKVDVEDLVRDSFLIGTQ